VYIKKLKGNGSGGGLFYTSTNSLKVEFIANNVTLYDLYQLSRHSTSIFNIISKNNVYIDG